MALCPAQLSQVLHRVTQVWHTGGGVGVDLFFVLSGFLISGLLFGEHQRHGSIRIGRFLIRRGFKIYPAFWVMLLATILAWLIVSRPIPIRPLIGELTFTQNYLGGLWAHTWSLAVEEHFYIGLSLLLLLLARRRHHQSLPFADIPTVFVVVALTCLALRSLSAVFSPYDYDARMWPTHARVDSLMFGVLLSWYSHYTPLARRLARVPSWLMALAGGSLFTPAFIFPFETTWWISVFGSVLFYVGSGLLVLAATRLKTSKSSWIGLLAALGAYSYSVYLWHMPFGPAALRLVYTRLGSSGYDLQAHGISRYLLYCALYIGGSFALGCVLAKSIEYPVLKFRDRVFPSRGRAIGSSQDKEASLNSPSKPSG